MQDDTKVLLAKQEVQTLLDTIQKQQQQFSDIPDQLPLDPNIPITFTKVSMKLHSSHILQGKHDIVRPINKCAIVSLQSDIFIVWLQHSYHSHQGKHDGVRVKFWHKQIDQWTILSVFTLTYSLSDPNIPFTFTKVIIMVSGL